ncbi:hypothetical protein LSH36_56g00012 [Paralvinella palmiformis]|uniref:Gamma-glutamyltransferase n=1 Tax=Paralvinella palmiformis TaxID=53620 RepID=A0AAD9NDW7_9ANNE|nr:hypothetical protein LSH36_56g00012 [Paralvinella palmiformis]
MTTEPLVTTTPAPPTSTDDQEESPKSATGLYRFGAVASDNEQCSRVGTEILAKYRGSSMDAAIATLFCLGVVHCPSTGIGGGFFMTIHDRKKKEVTTLISREVAPLFATGEISVEGGLSIAVPGQIAGYAEAHKRYGTLPWSQLVEPAIRMSEEGFMVNKFLQYVVETDKTSIMEHPNLRNLLTKSDGSLVKEGDIIKRSTYAKTLRRIAEEGPNTFYNGSVAEDVVRDIQDEGGNIIQEDLQNYTPLWKKPIEVTLSNGGYKLYGPPPPSSAVVMYYILNIMNEAPWRLEVLLAHRLVEAMKFGFGRSSYLGDEDFVAISEWVERLRSNSYAEETRFKINDEKVLNFEDYESASELPNDSGTTHLSVYGPDGISVSVSSSINAYFGSKVVGNRTGIIFNNQMNNFSSTNKTTGSPSNGIVPRKRPMSSMSPTIVLDKDDNLVLVIGSSGSKRIISGTLQDIRHDLELKGHKFQVKDCNFCVTQVINDLSRKVKDGRCIEAASDLRRNGVPDGY